MAQGPLTVDTTTLALGLAQIRVGASASNIANPNAALSASDSIGSLTKTNYVEERAYWDHESGYPALNDATYPLSVKARMEVEAEELTPYNIAIARGIDPTGGGYTDAHSGEVTIGSLVAPAYLRMEAHYVFPDVNYSLDIIFPRSQVTSNFNADFQKADGLKYPFAFEAKRADADVSGGNAVWNSKPLGRWQFNDAS
jgi:hypothetical protein